MANLTFDTYGKTRVRLMQVLRKDGRHDVTEVNVTILLQGKLANSYTLGDNSGVLPTDTMKNTVYALARKCPIESIEEFGLRLGQHFLDRLEHIDTVNVTIQQTAWDRIEDHHAAFLQRAKDMRTAQLSVGRTTRQILCGIRNLQILKTSNSAFAGYLRDEYTTLPETEDRLLGTVLDADWTLSVATTDFNKLHEEVKRVLLDCFAEHNSLSVQHTLHAMGDAVLNRFDLIEEIHLTMPNKHSLLVDLSRFGLDNPNQIFVPTDEPSGYIEARLTR